MSEVRRTRLLVVEDSEADFQTVRRYLGAASELRLEISWADTLAESLEILASYDVAACLIDVSLPDGSGHEVMSWLRQHRPQVAVVAQTGHETPHAEQLALLAGADTFLLKREWSSVELVRALCGALQHKRSSGPRVTPSSPLYLVICMDCKRTRDLQDRWHAFEGALWEREEVQFTHGICPKCLEQRLSELRHLTGRKPN